MNQIIRPHIPYQGPIKGGLHEGKRIQISGYVPYGADVFTVNLQTGLGTTCDRPLHLSIRFPVSTVVRNTLQHNSWGAEEKYGSFPFSPGNNFTLLIQVQPSSYTMSVDGRHCWEYRHRLPFTRVTTMGIDGDVQIERIEYIDKYQPPAVSYPSSPVTLSGSSTYPNLQPLPCTFPIYGGIRPGMSIHISGRPTSNPKKFTVNLQSGASTHPPPDIAFHFDVRFFNSSVVRNTRVNNSWSSEETMISYFPFQPGCHFDMTIQVQSDSYIVILNGQHFLSFRHRLNTFPRFNVLSIENDVIVTSVRYT